MNTTTKEVNHSEWAEGETLSFAVDKKADAKDKPVKVTWNGKPVGEVDIALEMVLNKKH